MAKKKEAENLPAPTMFAIAAELEAIRSKLHAAEGEIEDGDFESLKKWEAAIEVKGENIAHVLMKLEADAEYYDRVEKAAYARKMRFKNAYDRLKKYLRDAMVFSCTKSIKKTDGLFSISLVDGRTSAVIDDQNKLPLNLVEVVEVVKPRTSDIKKALESGADVPGAHLEQGEPYIQVR